MQQDPVLPWCSGLLARMQRNSARDPCPNQQGPSDRMKHLHPEGNRRVRPRVLDFHEGEYAGGP
jgi:hypothetical protein